MQRAWRKTTETKGERKRERQMDNLKLIHEEIREGPRVKRNEKEEWIEKREKSWNKQTSRRGRERNKQKAECSI